MTCCAEGVLPENPTDLFDAHYVELPTGYTIRTLKSNSRNILVWNNDDDFCSRDPDWIGKVDISVYNNNFTFIEGRSNAYGYVAIGYSVDSMGKEVRIRAYRHVVVDPDQTRFVVYAENISIKPAGGKWSQRSNLVQ